MVEVVVIGTDPPCLRCNLLVQRVYAVADENRLLVNIRRLPFQSAEAQVLAEEFQKKMGSAKDVARQGSVEVDWGRVAAPDAGTLVSGLGRGAPTLPGAGR